MNPKDIIPDLSLFKHSTPLQIRFNDIDILGHVNNTVYFSFYDTGKAHYFQSVRKGTMDWRKVDTVIANVNCSFISPTLFGDDIEVLTRCLSVHDKSFRVEQAIRSRKTGEVKSVCETVMVSFDPVTAKAAPMPDHWRLSLNEYEGRELAEPESSIH